METFLIKALQLILALSLLVALHEGGHFFFSKLFGVRVEKFFLFFDPWFHLISTKDKWVRKLRRKPVDPEKDKESTEYGVGWLPLGGYVKIAGMIDESMDTEQMKQPEQPWEFRAKPAWQRLLIMVGGVLVNFVLALFIYAMVLFVWGNDYTPIQGYKQGMVFNEDAKALGFQDHDILLGNENGNFDNSLGKVYLRQLSNSHQVTVMRQGKPVTIQLPEDLNLLNMLKSVPPFVAPYTPNEVDSVQPNSPAALGGLKKGDKYVAVNGKAINSHNAFTNEIGRLTDQAQNCSAADSLKLRNLTLVVERAGSLDTLNITMDKNFVLGFYAKAAEVEVKHDDYGFLQSFPAGIKYGWNVLSGYVSDLKYVFTKEGAKSVGGFASIGSIFPDAWDWHAFWMMTAFLSIILAFMNILPIPALDGGHVLFLLWEVITRRKPSEKFMEYSQIVGMVLLIGLMLWANFNDILKFLF